MRTQPRDLFHFTCEHGHEGITADGEITPAVLLHPDNPALALLLPSQYAWFTDLTYPHREALGLTSNFAECDRTTHRYRATDTIDIVPWHTIRRSLPVDWVAGLELPDGILLMHWWVSEVPVPATYDPR